MKGRVAEEVIGVVARAHGPAGLAWAVPASRLGGERLMASGIDTLRGVSFQHAATLHAILESMFDNDVGEQIIIEGAADIVDYAILDASSVPIIVAQVKSRAEPSSWGRADVVELVRRWLSLELEPPTTFEFITDASLNPSGIAVRRAIESATYTDVPELNRLMTEAAAAGLPSPASRIAQVRLRTRFGDTSTLLARVEYLATRLGSTQPDGVMTLLRLVIERSGSSSPAVRTLSRSELATTLGLPEHVTPGLRWGQELEAQLRRSVNGSIDQHQWLLQSAQRQVDPSAGLNAITSAATSLNVEGEEVSLTVLAASNSSIAVSAPPGGGKSTSAAMIERLVWDSGRPALLVDGRDYLPGRLADLVRVTAGSRLDASVHHSVGLSLLADSRFSLVIDGASELDDDNLDALELELRTLRHDVPKHCRLIAFGRDPLALKRLLRPFPHFESWQLAGFSSIERRHLALQLFPNSDSTDRAVREVEFALRHEASNPLIFILALSAAQSGQLSRRLTDLFESFLAALSERSQADLGPHLASVGGAALALARSGRTHAPYSWWERNLTSDLGADGASKSLAAAFAAGLMHRQNFDRVGFVHDALGDFVAARSADPNGTDLPTAIEAYPALVRLFVELHGVPIDLAVSIAQRAPWTLPGLARFDSKFGAGNLMDDVRNVLSELVRETELSRGATPELASITSEREGRDFKATFADGHRVQVWLEERRGPVAVAVALWSIELDQRLHAKSMIQRYEESPEALRQQLAEHVQHQRRSRLDLARRLLPPALRGAVDDLHPAAVELTLLRRDASTNDWIVRRRSSNVDDVRLGEGPEELEWTSTSTLTGLMNGGPDQQAVRELRAELKTLVGSEWPTSFPDLIGFDQ